MCCCRDLSRQEVEKKSDALQLFEDQDEFVKLKSDDLISYILKSSRVKDSVFPEGETGEEGFTPVVCLFSFETLKTQQQVATTCNM